MFIPLIFLCLEIFIISSQIRFRNNSKYFDIVFVDIVIVFFESFSSLSSSDVTGISMGT